jgi:hypothetical protein
MATLAHVKEFISLKVSAFDHEALATSLTTKSADGWEVVSIVAVGPDVIAYLSRPSTAKVATPSVGSQPAPSPASEPSGWAPSPSTQNSTPSAAQTSLAATVAVPTTTATTPKVPADWYKDPAGRFEYRYWDGTKWTEHVSRGGKVFSDPPKP